MPEIRLTYNSVIQLLLILVLFSQILFVVTIFYDASPIGNDLKHYGDVYSLFISSSFDLRVPYSYTGSMEPFFWFMFWLNSKLWSSATMALSSQVFVYVLISIFMVPKAGRSKFITFIIFVNCTFSFSHSMGNTLRAYCGFLILAPLVFRLLEKRENSLYVLGVLLLAWCTHYGAGMACVVAVVGFGNINNRYIIFSSILIVIMVMVVDFEVIKNFAYKLSVYTSPHAEGATSNIVLYLCLLTGIWVVIKSYNFKVPIVCVFYFVGSILMAYIYHQYMLLGVSRMALYAIGVLYLNFFYYSSKVRLLISCLTPFIVVVSIYRISNLVEYI